MDIDTANCIGNEPRFVYGGFDVESTPKLLCFIAQTKGLLSATRCRCEAASARQCFPNGIVSARRCYAHLRHRCEVASARQRFPNGIVSARRCYAHLRHRCEVASALQCFPNGIVSARRRYTHLRHRSLVRSGICPAVLGKWDHICKKMLICVQHKHPIAHVDVERHLGIVLLSFGILLHE